MGMMSYTVPPGQSESKRGDRAMDARLAAWVAVYGVILVSWFGLFAFNIDDWQLVAVYGWEGVLELCRMDAASVAPVSVIGMWLAMTAAMMVPGFVPAIRTYSSLPVSGGHGMIMLTAGYLLVWSGFALFAASGQIWVASWMTDPGEAGAIVALALAGAYQFTPWKAACIDKCRHPLILFLTHWSPSRLNAVQLGMRLGLYCLGCCWLLMSYGLIAGVMNLAWIGVATLFMAVEKLPRLGVYVGKPLGVALLAWAALLGLT